MSQWRHGSAVRSMPPEYANGGAEGGEEGAHSTVRSSLRRDACLNFTEESQNEKKVGRSGLLGVMGCVYACVCACVCTRGGKGGMGARGALRHRARRTVRYRRFLGKVDRLV